MRNALVVVGIGAIILAGGWWLLSMRGDRAASPVQDAQREIRTPSDQPEEAPASVLEEQGAGIGGENVVDFSCAGGKTMTAVFTRDILALTLSDGRQITMRERASAGGTSYLNSTETAELLTDGETLTLRESGAATYADCTPVR